MQNLHDIQEKIFFEAKNILETLSKINSKEELLAKQDLFAEITDRIAFLRLLEKNRDSFTEKILPHPESEELVPVKANTPYEENYHEDAPHEEDVIEEEVIFTNELNDIGSSENWQVDSGNLVNQREESLSFDDFAPEGAIQSVEETSGDEGKLLTDTAPEEDKTETDKPEILDENRRKIVEFDREETPHEPKEDFFDREKNLAQQQAEKKFKLAHIKGLKAVQNLFDEDPLENIQEDDQKKERKKEPSSLLKTNISTEFMEAEKRKPDFRLDLNDRVSFTKSLFKGNEEELKFTIDKLNSFTNLDEARQYLSEMYYLKDWSKNDELAQRLWSLVEGKFL